MPLDLAVEGLLRHAAVFAEVPDGEAAAIAAGLFVGFFVTAEAVTGATIIHDIIVAVSTEATITDGAAMPITGTWIAFTIAAIVRVSMRIDKK